MVHTKDAANEWECVIGLEVHAQILSNSKLFSGASTVFGAHPNSQVSLVDAAMPGMLPVLNGYCVEQAVKTGLAINGTINKISVFDRKNYFYADLPQGYQISQFYKPIVENGYLLIKDHQNESKKVRINRIHLEQDAGKSMHDQSPEFSLIDLNRSGVALMEIVSEPDLGSAFEAAAYVKKLRNLLRSIGSCDGNMDEGSLRCDVNISVRKPGAALGTRCEIKNVNSIKNIVKAIDYEMMRQIEILEQGGKIDQETRLFDASNNVTRSMRSKEDANDYRYFPDPDLLPVEISDELIQHLHRSLPELPDAKIQRYIDDLNLNSYDAEILAADDYTSKYFEEASAGVNAKLVANWISSELFGRLNKHDIELQDCQVTPTMIRELVLMIEDNTISGKIAKTVFEEMFATGCPAAEVIGKHGLTQVSDHQVLIPIIDQIIAANSDSVIAYKAGKSKLLSFFVGQVMKETQGKASPSLVNELLIERLK